MVSNLPLINAGNLNYWYEIPEFHSGLVWEQKMGPTFRPAMGMKGVAIVTS